MFARGRAGRGVRQLSLDLRRVMEPLTATRLQVCTPSPPSLAFEAAANLAGPHFPWLEKGSLVGTIAPASELRSSEGVHERTQLRAWLGS